MEGFKQNKQQVSEKKTTINFYKNQEYALIKKYLQMV